MTTRRPLTAQIKPATRNAIMDQLALAADALIVQKWENELLLNVYAAACSERVLATQRRWWHRFAWWRT